MCNFVGFTTFAKEDIKKCAGHQIQLLLKLSYDDNNDSDNNGNGDNGNNKLLIMLAATIMVIDLMIMIMTMTINTKNFLQLCKVSDQVQCFYRINYDEGIS